MKMINLSKHNTGLITLTGQLNSGRDSKLEF